MDPASFLKNTAEGIRNLCNFGGGNPLEMARQVRYKLLILL
jgi:hypothetical protein